jgi:hypothetical protein
MKQSFVVLSCMAAFVLTILQAGQFNPLQGAALQDKTLPVVANPENHGFSVKPSYSAKASKTLADKTETVIVAAYITGGPRQGTPKRYVSDMGEIGLGQAQTEVAPGQDATFGEIKLNQETLKYVDNQGPLLLINVYSGRKSSKNNLLDCAIYEGTLKAVQGTTIKISCKLIGE